MNSTKIRYYLMLLSIIFSFALYFMLSSSPSAAEMATAYYELIIHQNPTQIVTYGMSEETASTIISNIHTNLQNNIIRSFSAEQASISSVDSTTYDISLSNDDIASIEKAYFSALKKLEADVRSKKSDTGYTVTISSNAINFAAINQLAAKQALEDVDITTYSDHSRYRLDLVASYIPYLISGYENAIPVQSNETLTVHFIKQDGVFSPEDPEAFFLGLTELINYSN